MSQNQNPIYLSLAEAARLGGFSRKYLNVLVYRKKIPAEKMNGQWFIALEHFNDYLRQVHKREVAPAQEPAASGAGEQKILDAYIRQSEFLRERFTEMLVAEAAPTFLENRIEELERQLLEEQNEKQSLLYELQHLHDHMEQTMQQRLAEMADELNRKILEMKVTERLEKLQDKFAEATLPVESIVIVNEDSPLSGGLSSFGRSPEGVTSSFETPRNDSEEKVELQELPLSVVSPPASPEAKIGGDEEGVYEPLAATTPSQSPPSHGGEKEGPTHLHRHAQYHFLNFFDQARGVSLRPVAATAVMLAALAFINFSASQISFPAEVGLAWGDAAIANLSARADFVREFVAQTSVPDLPSVAAAIREKVADVGTRDLLFAKAGRQWSARLLAAFAESPQRYAGLLAAPRVAGASIICYNLKVSNFLLKQKCR